MWKKDEAVRPPQTTGSAAPVSSSDTGSHRPDTSRQTERDTVNIGKSVIIKGELSGSEDLTIEGQVEGKIELRQNVLTIGANGKIKAQVFAKAVIILGEVTGNVTATEKVDLRDNGSVDGDIASPRVAIAEGAHFRGSIDMQRGGTKATESKPASQPAAASGAPAQSSPQPAPAGAGPR